ncbi:MAG: hypothetical protein R2771_09420 [Saprospiraceae bacterium]
MIYRSLKYLFYITLFVTPFFSYSQVIIDSGNQINELKGIIYKNEYSLEAKLHTNGMSVGFNKAKIIKYYKTTFYHFELGFLKSIKQKKGNLILTSINLYNNYTYGKQNYFFPLRIGKGYRIYLSEKDAFRGVAVGYSLEAGLTLGIAKPYYLWVKSTNSDNQAYLTEIKYDEENAEVFMDQDIIFDKASIFKGVLESKFYPGAHLNAALHFGLKAYEKPVYAIETGIIVDAFTKRIPIMVETENFKNNWIFFNVFVNIHLGRRWN